MKRLLGKEEHKVEMEIERFEGRQYSAVHGWTSTSLERRYGIVFLKWHVRLYVGKRVLCFGRQFIGREPVVMVLPEKPEGHPTEILAP
jgi:hypothetical protein